MLLDFRDRRRIGISKLISAALPNYSCLLNCFSRPKKNSEGLMREGQKQLFWFVDLLFMLYSICVLKMWYVKIRFSRIFDPSSSAFIALMVEQWMTENAFEHKADWHQPQWNGKPKILEFLIGTKWVKSGLCSNYLFLLLHSFATHHCQMGLVWLCSSTYEETGHL